MKSAKWSLSFLHSLVPILLLVKDFNGSRKNVSKENQRERKNDMKIKENHEERENRILTKPNNGRQVSKLGIADTLLKKQHSSRKEY